MTEAKQKIVFFDGICHLCNGFIDFAIQRQSSIKNIYFAPLQGQTAEKMLDPADRTNLNSVIFIEDGQTYRQSEAVFRVLQNLQNPWRIFGFLGRLIPGPVSNFLYQWVAKNRYAWFGVRESCRLPEPQEKSQLLP